MRFYDNDLKILEYQTSALWIENWTDSRNKK